MPRYKQIAAEVDRRRKAGEGFDRLAREMKVSRGTILRAYDFANRDEAAARLAGRLADRLGRARAGPRNERSSPEVPVASRCWSRRNCRACRSAASQRPQPAGRAGKTVDGSAGAVIDFFSRVLCPCFRRPNPPT